MERFGESLRRERKRWVERVGPRFWGLDRVKWGMERIGRKFASHEEADAADVEYYRSLTPRQRMEILLEMVEQRMPRDEAERRLKRVYRVVELSRS